VLIVYRNQSQAGQPLLISSVYCISTLPFTWEQPHDCTTPSFSSFLTIRFRTAALFICRLTTLAFNAAHVDNICFNYEKLGYYLLDCLLPCAFYAKLKELKKLLKSDSEDDEYLKDKTEKDTF
jgi:hypothetical protein